MKLSHIAVLSCAVLFTASLADAAPRNKRSTKRHSEESYAPSKPVQHYMAGCGLGSLAIEDSGKWAQVGASILNGTGMQSFAISFGTSNCVEDGVSEASREKDLFIEANYADLQRDVAIGSGAYLSSLASLYGCKGESALGFGQVLHKNQAKVLSTTPAQASEVIDQVIRSEKASCQG